MDAPPVAKTPIAAPPVAPASGESEAESGDAARGGTPGAAGAVVVPASDTPPPSAVEARSPDFDPIVIGRVVDSETDEPIPGVHVVIVATRGESESWWGTSTDDEGAFRIEVGGFRPSDHAIELRAAVDLHKSWRGPRTPGSTDIRLERIPARPAPGRVRGVVRLPDGAPFEGILEADLLDVALHSCSRTSRADATGTFVFAGVDPGGWRFRVRGSRSWTTVTVPEGGDVEVGVRIEKRPETPAPWTEELDREFERTQLELMTLSRSGAAGAPDVNFDADAAKAREARARELHARISELRESRRSALPVRDVEVTGLPDEPYATLEARGDGRCWVVEVVGGRARFAALEEGDWALTLRRRVGPADSRRISVEAGEGPIALRF